MEAISCSICRSFSDMAWKDWSTRSKVMGRSFLPQRPAHSLHTSFWPYLLYLSAILHHHTATFASLAVFLFFQIIAVRSSISTSSPNKSSQLLVMVLHSSPHLDTPPGLVNSRNVPLSFFFSVISSFRILLHTVTFLEYTKNQQCYHSPPVISFLQIESTISWIDPSSNLLYGASRRADDVVSYKASIALLQTLQLMCGPSWFFGSDFFAVTEPRKQDAIMIW